MTGWGKAKDNSDTDTAQSTVTITDTTPTYKLTPNTATVAEGSSATFTVTLSEAAPSGGIAFNITYGYTGANAASAADLTNPPATVTVAANATTATLTINTATDLLDEDDETLTVTIAPATVTGWAKAKDQTDTDTAQSTVTITDTTPTYKLTPNTATVAEGSSATFTLTLSETAPTNGLAFDVTYGYTGANAASAADLTNPPATITVAHNNTTATLTIATATDTQVESTETLTIAVVPASGVTGWAKATDQTDTDTAQSTVTITDTTPALISTQTIEPLTTTSPTEPDLPNQTDRYNDINEAGPLAEDINALANRGIFNGTECETGRFCPQQPIRRWEFAVWLVRLIHGQDPDTSLTTPFDDLDPQIWWASHITHLAQLGITVGCKAATEQEPAQYCPHRYITRAEMAVFLYRAFNLTPAQPAGFTDIDQNWAAHAINSLYSTNLTRGCDTRTLRYCPDLPTSRAQAAAFLNRAINRLTADGD